VADTSWRPLKRNTVMPFTIEMILNISIDMNTLERKETINIHGGYSMSKTITLRLSEENYKVFRKLADRDNRPISNFIETAVKRFIEHNVSVDEFEMEEIRSNSELNKSLKRGLADMKSKKGRFVE